MASPSNEFPSLALIRDGIKRRFPITLRKLTLEMRPLSVLEEDEVTQHVVEELEKLPEAKRTSLKQSALMSMRKLLLAQRSDVDVHDEKMHEIELSHLTAAELQNLFKQYIAGCDKLNPGIEEYSKEEIQEWVSTLKKSSDVMGTILTELSFYQLAAICRHLLTSEELPEDSFSG